MKYLDTEWFTGGTGGVGIVFVEGEPGDEDLDPGQRGAYIGVASGISEKGDIRRILDYGVLATDQFLETMMAKFIRR